DRILVLEEGRILKIGSPAEIIDGLPVLGYDIHGTTNNSDELCRSCPTTPSSSSSAILSSNLPYLATSLPNSPLSASSQTIASSKHSLITRMLDLCRPYAALISGSCLLSASAIVANIALLGFSSLLICCASLSPPLLDLMLIIVAVRFFGISRAVLRYIERYISHDITLRILAKLRLWYYEQMEKLSYVSLQKLGLGRVFKHIIGDVDTLKFFYLRVLTVPLIAFIVWAAASIFLSMYSWKLVCLLSVFFVSGGIICPCLLRFALTRRRQGFSALRQDYSEALYDYINGLADRQIYDDKKECLQKIEKQGHNLANERYYIGIWEGFASTLTSFLANLALFAALAIMITQVAQGISNGLVLASIVWVIWAAFEALQPVTTMMEYLNQSRAALKGMEEAATRPQEPPRLGKAMLMAENGLVVEHLCFSYADDKPLLEDISFRLAPGSKTALLGNSGAGKTTLLNLLSGFLPYEKGRILNGETELNEVSATYLRQHIGYLEQKPYFFHASIRENIILAKKDTTEQELLSVLKKARLDEFINNLPMGLDTLVGENGYKLSAGQRQRLALARLFLQDAPLVILDEPTQSLDKENRASLFATLCEWWADKTVLYVTHDSFGLAVMDNIIFMEQGRLTEQGSEKELLQKGGKYMMNIMKYI
ncbi:MAG: thiol reductant ABC exporter subunit CydC, partial [Clostridiales bacterium]|nr:thiol reductant ABC exporter subunit CydC [Clostridiales bacterium]